MKEYGLMTQIVPRRLHWTKIPYRSYKERHLYFSCTLAIKESTNPRIE